MFAVGCEKKNPQLPSALAQPFLPFLCMGLENNVLTLQILPPHSRLVMYTPCKTFSKQVLLLNVYGQDHTAVEGAQLSEYVCVQFEAGLSEGTGF